ncbi:hypothetical protein B0H14DRAFT_3141660 [Mycena olivaceomarginata]|nr:hypothetical protein B0H14DRAFT_3141660 [Mycena olivaceomarginata]
MVRGVPLEYGTSEHNSDLVHFHIFYMPEKTVLKLFEREVGWEERRIPSTVDRIDDTSFIGEFVAHPVCCARADGTRQTFTVHVSSPDDSKFVPLPRLPPLPIEPVSAPKTGKKPQPKKSAFYCAPCHSSGESNSHKACLFDLFSVIIPHPNGQENEQCQPSAITKYQSTDIDADAKRPRDKEGRKQTPLNIPTTAEFVNTLKIAGRISAKARGKELFQTPTSSALRGRPVQFVMRVYLWTRRSLLLDPDPNVSLDRLPRTGFHHGAHQIPPSCSSLIGASTSSFTRIVCKPQHELGLFLPNAIIQPNGCAEQIIKAPNFLITVGKIKCYKQQPHSQHSLAQRWKQGSCERVIVDVKDEVNNTTLGLYSFRCSLIVSWSAQKIALEPGPLLVGRRKVLTSNQSVRKRPRADKIAKTSAPKRRKVEVVEDIENVNPVAGIMTRSQRKLASFSAGLQM